MANEKVLSFKIDVSGVSNEDNALAKLDVQIKNIKKEMAELEKAARKGIASNEQIRQLAAYNKELGNMQTRQKELTKVAGSAKDSLTRMRAELIRLKSEYANGSAELRNSLVPQISKLNNEVSKAEQAIGVHSRGVGNYRGAILDAGKQLLGFGGYIALAVTALNKLKQAFFETEQGAKFTSRLTQISKTFFQNLGKNIKDYWLAPTLEAAREAQKNTFKQLAEAEKLGTELDEIRKGDRVDLVEIAKLETELNDLRIKGADTSKSISEQYEFQRQASEKEAELIAYKLADKEQELAIIKKGLEIRKDDTILLDMQAQLEADIANIKGDKSLRLASKESASREKKLKEAEDALAEENRMYEASLQIDKDLAAAENKIIADQLKIKEDALAEERRMDEVARDIDVDLYNAEIKREEDLTAKLEEESQNRTYLRQQEEQAKMQIAQSATDILNVIAGKNKALLMASLIADKALAIAEVIIQTQKANAATRAWGALAGPGGIAFAEALVIKNKIAAGFSIAAIAAAAGVGLAGLSKAQYATGGKIKGGLPVNTGTKDNRLIAVNETETVLTDKHVAMLGGSATMRKIRVPGYASGGFIGTQTPEIPGVGFDYNQLARLMNSIEVNLNVNKVTAAQREIAIVTEPQRI